MRYVDSTLDQDDNDTLVSWLTRQLTTATLLTLRTGFYSAAALEIVQDLLEGLLSRGGEFVAVLGGELLQCDTDALKEMLDICRRHPEKARVHVVTEPVFQNAKTYHVTHIGGRTSAWVGSANFTIGGFASNLEAAITLDSDEDDPRVVAQVRAATLAAADQPIAAPLDEQLIEVLQRRVRESRSGFGRAAVGLTVPLVSGHGQQLLDHLDRMATATENAVVATGFPDLDDVLDGGLRPGTLTVVASRPGAGRSTLVLNILGRAAVTDRVPSCLFTFDTTAEDVLLRMLSADTGIDHRALRRGRLTETDWHDIAERMVTIDGAPLHVNAGHAPHVEALCAAVTAATARERLTLVAVDPSAR